MTPETEHLLDWLDDGAREGFAVLTSRLGDYETVQGVVFREGYAVVTAPFSDGVPTEGHAVPFTELSRFLADRTLSFIAKVVDPPKNSRERQPGQLRGYLATVPFYVALFVLLAVVAWRSHQPGFIEHRLIEMSLWTVVFIVLAGLEFIRIMGRMKRTRTEAMLRSLQSFGADSVIASQRTVQLSHAENLALEGLLNARGSTISKALTRDIYRGQVRFVDLPKEMVKPGYRKLFGPLSPARRLFVFPARMDRMAPRADFGTRWSIWACLLGLISMYLFAEATESFAHRGYSQAVQVAWGLAAALALVAIPLSYIIRRPITRRRREKMRDRAGKLRDRCEKLQHRRATDLSEMGRDLRWLERMDAFVWMERRT